MKKSQTAKLSLRRESLRVLSDKAIARANGGVYTSTNDVCSTESLTKCNEFPGYGTACYARN